MGKGTKLCIRHNNGEGAELPFSSFYRAKTGYYFSYCRTCAREALYEWRAKNMEKHKAITDKWKKANPDTLREGHNVSKAKWKRKDPERHKLNNIRHHLKNKHNVTPEWYAERLLEQRGVCAICGMESKRRLCVDHDHKTEQRRGLLCLSCNTALERMETIRDWQSKAQHYLDKYGQKFTCPFCSEEHTEAEECLKSQQATSPSNTSPAAPSDPSV